MLDETLSVVLALIFAGSAAAALLGAPRIRELLARLDVSPGLALTVALLEVAAAAGLVIGLAIEPVGAAAAVGLVLLMVGASLRHVRAGDAVGAVPAAALGLLSAVTAAALLRAT